MTVLAQEGGRIPAVFRPFEDTALQVILAISVLALVVAYLLGRGVLAAPQGTEKMREISRAIQIGSRAYLNRQFRTVGLFLGYSQAPVRDAVGGVLDILLGPLASTLPFYIMIMVLAVFTSLNSAILQGKLMDMDKMGEYQSRMQEIQERRKEAKERGDDEALEEIQEEQMEAMGDQLGMFKEQFRPMVWIMLVNIPVFLWIYYMVQTNAMVPTPGPVMVLPLFGEIANWSDRIGPMWAWIIWYFVCSMSFSQIVRKALDVQTTPDTS
jgi:uncharacterized membrane protein (DUF106 family)